MAKKRGVHVFWGHIFTALLFSLFGIWIATQYCAFALRYQSRLGAPLMFLGGVPVYEPWAWLFWSYHYEAYAPWVFERASFIMYGNFAVMFATMVFLAVLRGRRENEENDRGLHGSSRWLVNKELKNFGLIEEGGVVLAQTNDAKFESYVKDNSEVAWKQIKQGRHLLSNSGPEHVFCFAPTRSGKGVGLVIPTLLCWTGSVLIYDIKKELWAATSGFRRKFSHCLRFEPTQPNSVRFNPLMEIRKGDYEVRDVQNVADILVDPEGRGDSRDHWAKTGHALLVGSILHVLYAEPDKSLRGVANFLANPERTIFETLTHMLSCKHLGDKTHPVVASTAREMMNKSENELSGVLSTAMSFLGLYRDPIIAKNTEASDFKISDLMNSENPVSLYLVVPPSDIDRTKPLMRLMLNQIGRRLTEKMEFGDQKHYKHRLLMMLDEFPSLGNLSFFETELAYLAGYGIKCFMIAQSLNQIEKAYGPNNSILDNSHIRVTYGALDDRTAERISKLLGQTTEKRIQKNFSGGRLAPWLGHVMESEQETPRPLLTPGEVLQLPGDDALVMIGGMPPYRAKKVMYYQDDRFKGRAWLPAPDSLEEQQAELFDRPEFEWEQLPYIADGRYSHTSKESDFELKSESDLDATSEQLSEKHSQGLENVSHAKRMSDAALIEPVLPAELDDADYSEEAWDDVFVGMDELGEDHSSVDASDGFSASSSDGELEHEIETDFDALENELNEELSVEMSKQNDDVEKNLLSSSEAQRSQERIQTQRGRNIELSRGSAGGDFPL